MPYRPWAASAKSSRRLWAGIALLLSLGAHGLLLWLPVPPSPSPEPTAEAEPIESLPVTVLPAAPPPEPLPPEPVVAPSPAPPEPATLPTPQAVPQPRPVPAPQPPASQPPEPTPTPGPEPTPEPTPQPTSEPYSDFPHLSQERTACADRSSCWRVPASSWRSAAQDLKTELEAQGYQLSTVSEDTGLRIYAVGKDGEPEYYLTLISVAEGMLYAMTEEPMTSAELAAIQRF